VLDSLNPKYAPIKFLWIGLALLLVLGGPGAALAQDQTTGLSMSARAAFDGYFKYGEWLPVWVELENNGPDLEAEIQIAVRGSSGEVIYAAPVDLPTVSRKRVSIYVLPNNFSRELKVRLVSEEKELISQTLPVRAQPNITYLAGLLGSDTSALGTLKTVELPGQRRPMEVVEVNLEDLPERMEGLRSFDLLVINDIDTTGLSSAQASALEKWVRQGGRLVIGGGPGARVSIAGLPSSLQPVKVQDEVTLDALPGLSEFAGGEAIRVPGPFVLATGEARAGRALVSEDGVPLVQEMSWDDGFVDFVALDLTASPLDAWSGTVSFWTRLLSPGSQYPDWLPPDISMRQQRSGQMPWALTNLPALDLPSARSLTLLLGIYILLVGPVNYLVLRSVKRLHMAWVSIPLITLLFSGGAFGLGYALRGTDLILNKIALIETGVGEDAQVASYVGLFSPGRQSYEIEVAGDSLLSPVEQYYDPWSGPGTGNVGGNQMVFVQGEPGKVRGLMVNQWSMQSFMTESSWSDFGRIEGNLSLGMDRLHGTIHNDTGYPIHDAVLVLGSNFTRLGDLPAGEEVPVELKLNALQDPESRFGPPLSYRIFEEELNQPTRTGPAREVELKRMILDSVLQPGGYSPASSFRAGASGMQFLSPMLLGWMDQAPPQVSIAGRETQEVTTALVSALLEFELNTDVPFTLPPGIIPGAVIQQPAEGGICGDPTMGPGVYIGRGSAVFEFRLPEDLGEFQIEGLNVHLSSDGGWWSAPQTEVFDWEAESWRQIAEAESGGNLIREAESLVSQDGRVQIRLATEGRAQGCYYVGVGVDAAPTDFSGGS